MKKENKVVVLPEQDTKILREELEDLIIQANMLLQNKNFKNIETIIKNANKIITKINKVEEKLDNFEENIWEMVVALQNTIGKLQESIQSANNLEEQYKNLKQEIDKIVERHFLTLKADLKQQLTPYSKKLVREIKKDLNKDLQEFKEEIENGIENARKRFSFFEGSEIMEVLKEIDIRRKKANFMFYFAVFIFIVSSGVMGLTFLKVKEILKYTQ